MIAPRVLCALALLPAVVLAQNATAQPTSGRLEASDARSAQRPNSYADRYQVQLRAGEPVFVGVESAVDTMIYVYDAAGAVVAQDDDSGEGLNPLLEFVPPREGTYLVEVTTYSAGTLGSYTLAVGSAPAVTVLSTTAGELTRRSGLSRTRPGSYAQAHTLTLDAGESRQIDVRGEIDSMVFVYGPGGATVAQDDDGGEGLNPRLRFTSSTAGDYIVEVTTYGERVTGPYTLTISEVVASDATIGVEPVLVEASASPVDTPTAGKPDAPAQPARPSSSSPAALHGGELALGSTVTSDIGDDDVHGEFGRYEAWLLDVPAGTVVVLEVTTDAGNVPSLRVQSPDGRTLAAAHWDADPHLASTWFASAAAARLLVFVASGDDVAYTLSARAVTADRAATPRAASELDVGATRTVSAVQSDGYESAPVAYFELDESSTVAVRVSGSGISDVLWGFDVVAPTGDLIENLMPLPDDSGALGIFDLPPGRHLLRASPGEYRFDVQVEVLSGVWEAGAPLRHGESAVGRLEADRLDGYATIDPRVLSDIACHPLTVEAPGSFSVAVEGVGYEPAMTVFNDLGEEAATDSYSSGTRQFVAERPGTWWVCIYGQEWDPGRGEYSVRVW